jgi:hypothetical protein
MAWNLWAPPPQRCFLDVGYFFYFQICTNIFKIPMTLKLFYHSWTALSRIVHRRNNWSPSHWSPFRRLRCNRSVLNALLQVHPQGIRHVLADRRVNEWRFPQGKTIVTATSFELCWVYFELDLDGQLNEYQDRKAMGSTVLALSIAEVPEDRQRTPYLVSSLFV